MQNESMETMRFNQRVTAGSTLKLEREIKKDGTVTNVAGRFYQGQNLGLQVKPKLKSNGKMTQDLLVFPDGTRPYLCGNSEDFDYKISKEINAYDVVVIECENINTFDCDVSLAITIDHYGGKKRVV